MINGGAVMMPGIRLCRSDERKVTSKTITRSGEGEGGAKYY